VGGGLTVGSVVAGAVVTGGMVAGEVVNGVFCVNGEADGLDVSDLQPVIEQTINTITMTTIIRTYFFIMSLFPHILVLRWNIVNTCQVHSNKKRGAFTPPLISGKRRYHSAGGIKRLNLSGGSLDFSFLSGLSGSSLISSIGTKVRNLSKEDSVPVFPVSA
jgi:hypothetical protein